jgi:hypothetical protein
MSSGDDFQSDDTPFGEFAQQLQDDSGVDLRSMLSDDRMQTQQEQHHEQEQHHPQGQQHHAQGPPDITHGGMEDGQTIHDAAHWLGKPVEGAGDMVAGQFVASGDWSGGIVEDDVTPLEHRVVTDDHGKVTSADWVDTDGSKIADHQYEADNKTDDGSYFYYNDGSDALDESYDSGFDDGYQEGFDDAAAASEGDDYYSS